MICETLSAADMWKERCSNVKRRRQIIDLIKPAFNYFLFSGVFPFRMNGAELEFARIGLLPLLVNLSVMLVGYSHLFIGDPFNEVISKIEQTQFATISILLLFVFLFQFRKFRGHFYEALDVGSQVLDVESMRKNFRTVIGFEIVISSFLITSLHVSPILLSATYNSEFYARLDNKLYVFFLYFTNNFFLLECIACNFFFYLQQCFSSINNSMSAISSPSISILQPSSQQSIINKLKRLIRIRQQLLELTIKVNETSHVLLLSSSWISLFEIMFSAYYAVVFVFDRKSYDYEQTIFHNYLIAWMLYHSLRFTFVCFACEQLTQEAQKTGQVVQKLMNKYPSKNVAKKVRCKEDDHTLIVVTPIGR